MSQRVSRASDPGGKKRNRRAPAGNEAPVSADAPIRQSESLRDIRVAFGLPQHPKTKRLIRLLGFSGAWHLLKLWLWVGANHHDGSLSGKSDDDLELAVDWPGDPGELIAALVATKFIEGPEFERVLHDWADHNGWIASHPDRSEKAKFAAICKHHSRGHAERKMPEYAAKLRARSAKNSEGTATDGDASGMPVAGSGSAPVPVPVPVPVPLATPNVEVQPDSSARITAEAARACALMKRAGVIGFSAAHPQLIAAITEGVPPELVADCAAEAIRKRKQDPFVWAIGAARGRHADRHNPPPESQPQQGNAHETDRRSAGESLADYAARRNAAHDRDEFATVG